MIDENMRAMMMQTTRMSIAAIVISVLSIAVQIYGAWTKKW